MHKFFQKYSLFLIVLVACVVRLPLLNGSFWMDEAAQVLESARPLSQQLQIAKDFQPPLFHLLIHAALKLNGSEWFLRFVGAYLPGIITVGISFLLLRKVWNAKIALMSTLLIATSSFHVFYSQELRPYSLAALWGVLSSYVLLLLCTDTKWSWKKAFAFVLITTAGVYTMYVYSFLALAQLAAVGFVFRNKLVRILQLFFVSALTFIPWLPAFFEQLSVGQQLRSDLPGWAGVVGTPFLKSLPMTIGKFVFGVLNIELTLLFMLPVILGLVVFVLNKKSILQRLSDPKTRYLLFLFFGTLLSAWLLSAAIPVLQPKRVLFLLPLFYGLFVFLLVEKNKLGYVFFAFILAVHVFALKSYWTDRTLQREDWKSLQQTIVERYPLSRVVVFSFPDSFAPWDWYDAGQTPKVLTPYTQKLTAAEMEQSLKTVTEYEYVLVFDYLRDLTDPEHKIEQSMQNFGFVEREKIDGGTIGFVRVFSRRTAVLSYMQEDLDYHALSRN